MEKQKQLRVIKLYLKEKNLNNQGAPISIMNLQQGAKLLPPKMDISVNVNKIVDQKDTFEVSLSMKFLITQSFKDKNDKTVQHPVLDIQILYAGLFIVSSGSSEEGQKYVLNTECPSIIFPYLSKELHSSIYLAGFPTFNIDIIDFKEMYNKYLKEINKDKELASSGKTLSSSNDNKNI